MNYCGSGYRFCFVVVADFWDGGGHGLNRGVGALVACLSGGPMKPTAMEGCIGGCQEAGTTDDM